MYLLSSKHDHYWHGTSLNGVLSDKILSPAYAGRDVAVVIIYIKSGFQDCNSKLKLLVFVTLCSVRAGVDQDSVQREREGVGDGGVEGRKPLPAARLPQQLKRSKHEQHPARHPHRAGETSQRTQSKSICSLCFYQCKHFFSTWLATSSHNQTLLLFSSAIFRSMLNRSSDRTFAQYWKKTNI